MENLRPPLEIDSLHFRTTMDRRRRNFSDERKVFHGIQRNVAVDEKKERAHVIISERARERVTRGKEKRRERARQARGMCVCAHEIVKGISPIPLVP
jgi:hypothetical protein